MKRLILGMLTAAAILALTACTVVGAVAGGVAGHELIGGKGGTIGGAVAGGVIGHEIGK